LKVLRSVNGVPIRLTQERLLHIYQGHPELEGCEELIAETLIHYDSEADVLYISFGEPRPAEGLDIGDGTILRIGPKTEEVIGLTILDFSKRVEG